VYHEEGIIILAFDMVVVTHMQKRGRGDYKVETHGIGEEENSIFINCCSAIVLGSFYFITFLYTFIEYMFIAYSYIDLSTDFLF
jgi:hypothetical protein